MKGDFFEGQRPRKRTKALAILLLIAGLPAYVGPLGGLFRGAYSDETFSYIVIIPSIFLYIVFDERKRIFGLPGSSPVPGAALSSLGILVYFAASRLPIGPSGPLAQYSLHALSAVLVLGGVLGLLAGARGLWAARFPMLLLLFMIPIPRMILDPIVGFLQAGSAEVSFWIIRALGVPIFRDGFHFSLPGLSVEVAKQCSGIRSSLSLVIVGLLAGHFFLKSAWRRAALVAAVVPIAIAKNGLRIVTLSLLGAFIDPQVLNGPLHKAGGIPFFAVALLMLGVVVLGLMRGDVPGKPAGSSGETGGAVGH